MAVPTHLYKVILAEEEDTHSPALSPSLSMAVFVVPNEPLEGVDLSQFQTTLHDLETMTGIQFHSKLNLSQVIAHSYNTGNEYVVTVCSHRGYCIIQFFIEVDWWSFCIQLTTFLYTCILL